MGRLAWICAAVLAAACGFNPTGGMPADDVPDIDAAEADIDAPIVEIDGSACAPRCQGAQLIGCTGGVEDPPVTCAAGCVTSGTAHCGVLVPSNGASAADLGSMVTAELLVAAGRVVILDSDTGAITSYLGTAPTPVRAAGANVNAGIRFRVQLQSGGAPDLAVFAVAGLTVEDGGTLKVAGARPVLLLVGGAATLAGAIELGAGRSGAMLTIECQTCAGAGGGDGATSLAAAEGCAPGEDGAFDLTTDETGGGGGGLGVTGAAGGDSDADGGGFSALSACPGPSLVPLRGGSGGGRGGFDPAGFGGLGGGGGGGAMQITSMTSIALSATADLYAGGAGGLGSLTDYGGGGGGAGGAFLLEAPAITVTSGARITANGGGGGAGRTSNRGENGARSETQRASGGAGDGPGMNDGRGGLGGISATSGATQGMGGVDGTGGGGGGAGILRMNTVSALGVPAGAVISPPHTAGTAVVQ